jgi:RNA polymerase-binding transcription factor DksA
MDLIKELYEFVISERIKNLSEEELKKIFKLIKKIENKKYEK